MIYVNLMDQVCKPQRKMVTVVCAGCGVAFEKDARSHSTHCEPCRKLVRRVRRREYMREWSAAQRVEDRQCHDVEWLALNVIAQAARDTCQPAYSATAITWLRRVGVDWLHTLGYDTRGALEFVREHACMEQGELEGVSDV